ncbi:MAG: aminotransferase class V-fold PLP-dependent enzyme [Planctomycetota bacterium]|nr:MAG: aminotransferase class V-fold PLP-dependent enzyme [Planctomycetota bacterium]
MDRTRKRVADLLGAPAAERIVFAFNGTDALNMALHGLLRPGDHVVTTAAEHNSVMRPLHALRKRGVEMTIVPVDAAGRVDPDTLVAAIGPATRCIAVTHASNVTGAVQPVEAIVARAREHGVAVLIDAAQTAGHVPLDVRRLGCSLLACSGHKGLLGPLGTGVLYVAEGMEQQIEPLRQGGTGSFSELLEQPQTMPDRFESGNPNVVGLLGLEAAVEWLTSRTVSAVRAHIVELLRRLRDGLASIPGVRVFGPEDVQANAGIVSFALTGADVQTVASVLDQRFGIEARAGLHCAPLIHAAIGSDAFGGTVRFAPGPFTTPEEIDAAVAAVEQIAHAFVSA